MDKNWIHRKISSGSAGCVPVGYLANSRYGDIEAVAVDEERKTFMDIIRILSNDNYALRQEVTHLKEKSLRDSACAMCKLSKSRNLDKTACFGGNYDQKKLKADQYKGYGAGGADQDNVYGADCNKNQSNSKESYVEVVKKSLKKQTYEKSSKASSSKKTICWYFENTRCKFGKNCRNIHLNENIKGESNKKLHKTRSLPDLRIEISKPNSDDQRKIKSLQLKKPESSTKSEAKKKLIAEDLTQQIESRKIVDAKVEINNLKTKKFQEYSETDNASEIDEQDEGFGADQNMKFFRNINEYKRYNELTQKYSQGTPINSEDFGFLYDKRILIQNSRKRINDNAGKNRKKKRNNKG